METTASEHKWLTRERALLLVLAAATVIALYLSYLLFLPFFPILAWALALAVVAHPMHRWIAKRVPRENLAAGLAVVVVAVGIVAPVILLGTAVVNEAAEGVKLVREKQDRWRALAERNPRLAPALRWVERRFDVPGEIERITDAVASHLPAALTGSLRAIAGLFIMFFVLFFFFRDRRDALQTIRQLVPLSQKETDQLFERVSDTIHATIFGTVVVALIQGSMGGLMFWLLGIPGALLWGLVMSLLAMVPMLGTFLIWGPAAIFLALEGSWGKGLILAGWGALAIGLIDNFLYPTLVGKRLRLHTLLVFFSVLGGLSLFGLSGVILGPLTLAILLALMEIWRARTEGGQAAEEGAKS
jgi:predicted PurR-regulated permease PerM